MENSFDSLLKEVRERLLIEILENRERIESVSKTDYYNEHSGDLSFLLSAFLGVLLDKEESFWSSERWLDDSLLTKISFNENRVKISGIMIWGIDSSTEQWTDPFCCELQFDSSMIDNYTFQFGDEEKESLSYSDFSRNRNYWDSGNESTDLNREWKYRFSSNG